MKAQILYDNMRLRSRLLLPSGKMNKGVPFNEKWKLWINEEIEVEV